MICATCGKPFVQVGPGRRRKHCYVCHPERRSSTGAGPSSIVPPASVGYHCPQCGAYVKPGERFCNPRHRALFVEKVAAAKNGGKTDRRSTMQGGRKSYDRKSERGHA